MRGESASENTYPNISDIAGKRIKRYVDHSKDRSKLTFLIHGPRYSSDECKVSGDFGSKYSNIRPAKDCGKKFCRKKDNNAIV